MLSETDHGHWQTCPATDEFQQYHERGRRKYPRKCTLSFADPEQNVLLRNLQTITASAENIYDKICQINTEYATLSDSDARIAFRHKWEYAGLELLKTFRKAQDYLVRLNWQDEVIFPQEAASKNIRQLEKASRALSEGNITDALKALYRVDNNMYAFLFDEEVYYHFNEYILHQPKDPAFIMIAIPEKPPVTIPDASNTELIASAINPVPAMIIRYSRSCDLFPFTNFIHSPPCIL